MIKHTIAIGVMVAGTFGLSACGTLTGLDANSNFKCKAPDGVACASMSGIYANAEANNLPAQQTKDAGSNTAVTHAQSSHEIRKLPMPNASSSGQPLFKNPEILRIWVAPWEAADRTLYDQNYMYVVVDFGQWQIEHNRNNIRAAFAPIEPPKVNRRPTPARQDNVPLSTSTPMPTTNQ